MGPVPSPSLQGHPHARELQSPCLAACESGLEGNAVTICELPFCYYWVLSLVCSWPVWAPGRTVGPAGADRGEKLSTQIAALGVFVVELEDYS